MFRTLVKISGIVLVMGIITLSLVFSWRKMSAVKCTGVTVILMENTPRFAEEDEIAAGIEKSNEGLIGRRLYSVNTEKIERQLGKISSVSKAEVYRQIQVEGLELKGQLVAEIAFREPLFRVVGEKDYYMDREGVPIFETRQYPVRVLIVTGTVEEQFAKEKLVPLIAYLRDDSFWNAQIQQINVVEDGEIEMVPLVGDHLVEFGSPEGYRDKLRNLRALYEQGFAETGWGRYQKISLKYKNQVVCTRK